MNYTILNNASLNTATVPVIVAVLALGGLSLDSYAEANVKAFGGSAVTLSVEGSAYGYQQHNATAQVIVPDVSGTASAIRQAGLITKTDFLNTSGSSMERHIYSYGGSSSTVDTSGVITPNYFIEPDYMEAGVIDTEVQVDGLKLVIGRAATSYTSLSGNFVVPRMITVEDIYFITSLDGFAIPANALGKGEAGTLGVEVTCDAVRTVLANASPTLIVDGSSTVTNDAVTLKHQGYLPTTGVVNVTIKEKHNNYLLWYYEDWLTFDTLTGTIEPLVFKGAVIPTGSLAVSFDAVGVRRATAELDDGYYTTLVSTIDPDRKAGLIAAPVSVRLTGSRLTYGVNKPAVISATLGTAGAFTAVVRILGLVNSSSELAGNSVQQNTITPASVSAGVVQTTGTTLGVRRTVASAAGTTNLTTSVQELVLKKSYGTAVVATTGTAHADVMFTTTATALALSGYGFARRIHVGQPVAGVVGLADSKRDFRAAIRPDDVLVIESLLIDSGNDYRTAVRWDQSDYWNTLTSDVFDVVNLYARADETRQVIIPYNPYAGANTAHYIQIAG